MYFTSYTKSDTHYTFNGDNGYKLLMPLDDVILIDDESGAIAVKTTASRTTLGYLHKNN